MRKPKSLAMNPQEHEFSFYACDQGKGELPTVLATVPDGGEWCMTAQEAERVGKWFLTYSKWVKERLKAK